MSFSSEVKKEIISKGLSKTEKKAFLSGFIRSSGLIVKVENEIGFEFSTESEETEKFVLYLIKSIFSAEPSLVEVKTISSKKRTFIDFLGSSAIEILRLLEILLPAEDIRLNNDLDGFVSSGESEKRGFIKGVFLGSGNITLPHATTEKAGEKNYSSTGYHLEFVFTGHTQALNFASLLAGVGILTKLTERKGNFVIYVKSSAEIKDFLAFIGAYKSALKVTDLIIAREISEEANRRTNCDLANVNKQMDAALRILKVIDSIDREIGLSSLPASLYEIAVKRKENPELTMQELADELNISKSCLNHRLRKLTEIEKNLTK